MAAIVGGVLVPVRTHSASESAYLRGQHSVCSSSQCAASKLSQAVCVKAQGSGVSEGEELKQLCKDVRVGGSAISRRDALAGISVSAATLAALFVCPENSSAVQQSLLAGRIPGLSEPDTNGLRTYRRPDAKSGGHGVGWSPMTPYSFKVPQDWEEVPVSIADLGGTEIDLRFASSQEGNISVVVAPVLRFSNTLGDNATIEAIGSPEKVIDAFGPEITGQNVEGKVKDTDVKEYGGRKYYQFELDGPHVLISATAAGNRLYLMSVTANGRQWKKYAPNLKQIVDSFRVG